MRDYSLRNSMSLTTMTVVPRSSSKNLPFQPKREHRNRTHKNLPSAITNEAKKDSNVPQPLSCTTLVFDEDGRVLSKNFRQPSNDIELFQPSYSNDLLLNQHLGDPKNVTSNLQRKKWTSSVPTPSGADNEAPVTDLGVPQKNYPPGVRASAKPIKSEITLPKIKRPVILQSVTRESYRNSNSDRRTKSSLSSTYRAKQAKTAKSAPEVRLSSHKVTSSNEVRNDHLKNALRATTKPDERIRNYESEKMRTARSEISLLEQKRLQWAKEREELNGLWSPWGRQPENMSGRHSPTLQMQASYPSPTNVVPSSYVSNLGIGSNTYTSQSECYLPPINSTIAQLPRQKAKVWNAEFQTEDYRYENDSVSSSSQNPHPAPPNSHRTSRGQLSSRKASLPNYMYENAGGEIYNYSNNGNYSHQQMIFHQHNKFNTNNNNNNNDGSHSHNNMWSSTSMDDEAFTSGYYSSENNVVDEGHPVSQNSKEIILKPTSRERSYQEEVTVQKAIAIKGRGGDKSSDDGSQSPRVIVHKIYAQNGEVFAEHDGSQEYIVNSMTISSNGGGGGSSNRSTNDQLNSRPQEGGRSPMGTLPRNHAMRSSLTIGVDASNVDAYYENDRRKKEQWLIELEQQREEQRLRKMMEKEERRPRWGDRGIGVGHFWEPSESENSHLPPYTPRGKVSGRSESVGNNIDSNSGRSGGGGGGGCGESYPNQLCHPGQSNTPPAWLERSLTRMQSSKSQPSLHDPEYINDFDYPDGRDGKRAQVESNSYNPSRSLNQSTIDLRNVAGYSSPTGDSDRTFLRGQNVPIDPDTFSERERKRQANQEHLEALKKQIEERQQKQKEELEKRKQEEREHEIRIAKQREIELQRLEKEKRGKMPVNGDMPNCVEETSDSSKQDLLLESATNSKPTKISTLQERASQPIRDASEEKDIEIVQRQSVMMVTDPIMEDKTEASCESLNGPKQNHYPRLSRQDQCVMTDSSDAMYERTLTPSIQRSRSLSLCRSSREFGTQTELSDGSSTSSGSGSSYGSGKNSEKTRSHNSLLDKKSKDKDKQQKKSEERPRWGSNPVKKQYIKQSEKDPNYKCRIRRRQERLKRMEEERSARADTGTESEDVSIPFYRIRQRRNNSDAGTSPMRSGGIKPMKATVPLQSKTEKNDIMEMEEKEKKESDHSQSTVTTKSSKTSRISPREAVGIPHKIDPCPHSHPIKSSKSEMHLNRTSRNTSSDIIDRNFGSVAGINTVGVGTSEESSGFSTPFLPRRDLGTGNGSSGSGTTGSGSGVQSPDLAYHTYRAEKSTMREERRFSKSTSERDKQSNGNYAIIDHIEKDQNVKAKARSRREFKSPLKGFIHQEDFDEMPIKPMQSSSVFSTEDTVTEGTDTKVPEKSGKTYQSSSDDVPAHAPTTRGRRTSPRGKAQRNKSISPKRKPLPSRSVKVPPNKPKGNTVDKSNLSNERENDETVLPNVPLSSANRPASPPVPALLKKMQMGLQPDESGRISSLPTEFPDILAPLPAIPLQLLSPTRLSSATSGTSSSAPGKIDIDIAVTKRNSPEVLRLLEAADERLKQRQMTAILNDGNNNESDNGIFDGDNLSGRARPSFEADIGSISINLEPLMMFNTSNDNIDNMIGGGGRYENAEFEIPLSSARLSIKSHSISPRSPHPSHPSRNNETARHEAFITSILNSKEVKEQLSARESELSEKGIIEFSIKLPSTSSGDDFNDEYRDPLLTERRRHTAQWLYGNQGGGMPQKQAILTNLSSLKKGLSLQKQEWKVGNSDTE